MKKILLVLNIILLISCNQKEFNKEKENLILKLDEKELIIRDQIVSIEEKKSEIKLLNQELKLLKESFSKIKPKKELYNLYNEVKSSVYLIYTENEKGTSQGSAFVVSKEGMAISNYHVFKNASSAIAINGKGNEFLISEIIEKNEEKDYIIFKLGPLTNSIPFLKISENIPNIGEDVFAVGNPNGLRQTLSKGIISSYRKHLIQTTTEITHGSSGGPLFNDNGEVIGITSSGMGEANLNFAVNINNLNLPKYLEKDKQSFNNRLNERDLIKIMNNYYNKLKNEDMYSLFEIYEKELSRFHGLYSINKSRAIKDHKDYLSKYEISLINILPQSVRTFEGNESYTIQYKMEYNIIRRKNNKPYNYILNTVCVISKEGKIKSIYDDITQKN
ncbi:S1C family serine protease [Polaribacter sp. NJDZ03]|uniref:S1C family serine protease n=1 Tax=Polaribacter sp. NJDZ03 TaxID=2855841 RepID=UPI001C4A4F7A|nr:serine protease [Polaribacter sp. NJDZ03]